MADSEMVRSIFHKQVADLNQLENGVNALIKMSSQMTAGQDRKDNKGDIPYELWEIAKWQVLCEAVALICDKRWSKIKEILGGKDE